MVAFCRGKKAVLMVEEGAPDYHRAATSTRSCAAATSRPRCPARTCCRWAANTPRRCVVKGLREFLRDPCARAAGQRAAAARIPTPVLARSARQGARRSRAAAPAGLLHRLPGAADLRGDEAGREGTRAASRLRRHRLPSVLDPAALQHRRDDDGLRPRARLGLRLQRAVGQARRSPCMGDGGFWHNGLASSIGNAVFNKQDGVTLIVDNFYSAATGGQDIPSSRALNPRRKTNNSIVDAVQGRRRDLGAADRPHLRRRQDARHAARGADDQGRAARRSSSPPPNACSTSSGACGRCSPRRSRRASAW